MDRRYLDTIAPLIKDKMSWDAFIVLLQYEYMSLVEKLNLRQDTDNLIRINAKLELITYLKKYKERTDGLHADK